MRVLVIDNYDSFTFNLQHYLEQLTSDVTVKRNDQISLAEVEAYSHIIISPGPGLPNTAGITNAIIKKYASSKSILGICLGCQAIAEVFGAKLYNQENVSHGIQREVYVESNSWLFKGLPNSFKVGLYHSWAIDSNGLDQFKVVANNANNTVMAIEHENLKVAGVQFHPESIMSEYGLELLRNWLEA